MKTLMTWAARDNDRTMLYGAESEDQNPKSPSKKDEWMAGASIEKLSRLQDVEDFCFRQ
jgi:hypothetical protein